MVSFTTLISKNKNWKEIQVRTSPLHLGNCQRIISCYIVHEIDLVIRSNGRRLKNALPHSYFIFLEDSFLSRIPSVPLKTPN